MTLWTGFKEQHSASDDTKIGPNKELLISKLYNGFYQAEIVNIK